MSKTNNDNIEDFFRKGLSQQESPFMEEDWKKMEKLLNAHDAGRAAAMLSNSAKVLITSAIVLLLITSTLFVLNNPDRKTPAADKGLSTNQAALGPKALESKDGNPSAALIYPEDKKPQEKNEVSEQTKGVEQVSAEQTSATKPKNNITLQKNGEVQMAPDLHLKSVVRLSDNKNTLRTDHKNDTHINENSAGLNYADTRLDVTGSERTTSLQGNPTDQERLTARESIITNTGNSDNAISADKIKVDSLITKTDLTEATKTEEKVEKDKPLDKVPSRWSVAMVMAPDYSSTEMRNFTSPGKSYGLLIGFNVTKRFSISSGLFRSSKLYTGYGNDYQPPEGYWQRKTNGIVPDEINGACEVWEIPLMLQYAVVQREKSRLYGSLGMTSYLITHEKYEYCFNNPNPGAASSWSTNKSTTYPFNVGYMAVGYEHKLTKHLSLGLEPFVKIPFRGMGWSHVNIYSTGAYLTARYRLLKKS
jgi:hypothetical protein